MKKFDERSVTRLIDLEYFGIEESDLEGREIALDWFRDDEPYEKTLLRMMRDPANFHFTCRHLLGWKPFPYQVVALETLWTHKFPMLLGSRGFGKSTILGVFALLYAIFKQGSKVVVTGAGFRQAKLIIEGVEQIIQKSPVFQSMFGRPGDIISKGNDRWVCRVGDSRITALPMGDGSTIRGERAHLVIGDEFASINRDVFEQVVRGFGVVMQDPDQNVRRKARIRVLKRLGLWSPQLEEIEQNSMKGNQLIISGTAYYQFNHFYDYWKKWKLIIESQGDAKVLQDSGIDPAKTNWKDFAIIRAPWESLPEGYYDDDQIEQARHTNTANNFAMEYDTVFPSDTHGFFPRSLIESCTTNSPIIPFESDAPIMFTARSRGDGDLQYVYGVDPAMNEDKFAVVILEVHPTHRRVVHCWTINKKNYRERERAAGEEFDGYFAFCARKIRDLMKIFPCSVISIDSQGGGGALLEALGDKSKLQAGERPLLPISPGHPLHNGKKHPDDDKSGLHIVELVNFRDSAYTSGANNDLRKDMEDRAILFPFFDQAGVAIDVAKNELFKASRFDTYDDVCHEILELQDELSTIQLLPSANGLTERWDTPEIKLPGAKKGRMRKDRYSALIMANYAARRMHRAPEDEPIRVFGGAVIEGHDIFTSKDDGVVVSNPDWWNSDVLANLDLFGAV